MPARIHIQHRIAAGIEVGVLTERVCKGSLIRIPCQEPAQLGAVVSGSEVVQPCFGVVLLSGEEEGGIRGAAMEQ